MKFKTELHCHSAPVSACAKAYPEEIVQAYVEHGYHSLVLTNHFSRFTFKNKRMGDLSALPWHEKVDYYMKGYYDLVEAAAGKMDILFGCELRSNIDENDYLIYGLDEKRGVGRYIYMSGEAERFGIEWRKCEVYVFVSVNVNGIHYIISVESGSQPR